MLRSLFWKYFCKDIFSRIDHINTFRVVILSRIWPKFEKIAKNLSHKHFVSLRHVNLHKSKLPSPTQVFLNEILYLKLHENLVFFEGTWLSILLGTTETLLPTSFDTVFSNIKIKLLNTHGNFVTAHIIARDWPNPFNFITWNKTAGKNCCCLVA